MRPHRLALAAACATFVAFTTAAHAKTTSVSVSIDDDKTPETCDDIKIWFGNKYLPRPMVREEETLEGTGSTFRAALSEHGHVIVRGWDQDRTSVVACKAAGGTSEGAAREILQKTSVTFRDGTLSLTGPSDMEWVTYFLVRVPRRATLDLSATNGSIRVDDVAGSVRARTVNGPVSLTGCTGDVDARAENGPIALRGDAGKATLHAENGPIEVTLTGNRWRGESLEASTQNGPLSLKLPAAYASGVEVRASGYGPVSCEAEACRQASKTWDEGSHRITFGASPVAVRLTTVNGPIAIGAPED